LEKKMTGNRLFARFRRFREVGGIFLNDFNHSATVAARREEAGSSSAATTVFDHF
jgi:hypothetical protein